MSRLARFLRPFGAACGSRDSSTGCAAARPPPGRLPLHPWRQAAAPLGQMGDWSQGRCQIVHGAGVGLFTLGNRMFAEPFGIRRVLTGWGNRAVRGGVWYCSRVLERWIFWDVIVQSVKYTFAPELLPRPEWRVPGGAGEPAGAGAVCVGGESSESSGCVAVGERVAAGAAGVGFAAGRWGDVFQVAGGADFLCGGTQCVAGVAAACGAACVGAAAASPGDGAVRIYFVSGGDAEPDGGDGEVSAWGGDVDSGDGGADRAVLYQRDV